jgi:hypothetical protein
MRERLCDPWAYETVHWERRIFHIRVSHIVNKEVKLSIETGLKKSLSSPILYVTWNPVQTSVLRARPNLRLHFFCLLLSLSLEWRLPIALPANNMSRWIVVLLIWLNPGLDYNVLELLWAGAKTKYSQAAVSCSRLCDGWWEDGTEKQNACGLPRFWPARPSNMNLARY